MLRPHTFFNDPMFELVDRLVGAPTRTPERPTHQLALDIFEHDDTLTLRAAVPGFGPDEVEVTAHDGVLTIKAEKTETESDGDGPRWYRRELRTGTYSRAVRLPKTWDLDKAEAGFEHGVLTLTVPKAASAQPRVIQIGQV